MDVFLPAGQMHDRVSDELAGAVKGHVSAPIRLDHLGAPTGEFCRRRQEVFAVGALPQRENRRMLGEKKYIRDFFPLPTSDQFPLQLPGATVAERPHVESPERRCFREFHPDVPQANQA